MAGSLSKTYAMTGWRIGFILGPAAVASAVVKLQSHSTSNPTSIAQKAAIEAVHGPQGSVPDHVGRVSRAPRLHRKPVEEDPRRHPVRAAGRLLCVPECVVRVPGRIRNSLEFADRLLERSVVAVVPGEAFGTQSHIRISYATSMHELERGLDRLDTFIQRHSG